MSALETMDPRESITWSRGWVDAFGVHTRVRVGAGDDYPFESEHPEYPGDWFPDQGMGRLPHRMVKP